jgi:hypothetical protein
MLFFMGVSLLELLMASCPSYTVGLELVVCDSTVKKVGLVQSIYIIDSD